MAIDRRSFLRASAAQTALLSAGLGAGAGLGLSGCRGHPGARAVADGANPFVHGVASGDPLADRVILWTRVSPDASRIGEPIRTHWWIARDARGRDRVAEGRADALAERDYTLKLDVAGLEPATSYSYGFSTGAHRSRVGRTRTIPRADLRVDRLRFAVASCSNYPEGFFNPYAAIAAREDIDAVLHLGDYLYEYGNGEYGDGRPLDRVPDPTHEIVSLEDYRRRHAHYKTDPDLQAAHARHPWISVWDDHESADDSWATGADNHDPWLLEGRWSARRMAAVRAYHEWMPIRELPTGLFRVFDFGRLAQLVMLDTRLEARDRPGPDGDHVRANDPERTLLGAAQEERFLDALTRAHAANQTWKLVGQQVIVAPLTDGRGYFNSDTWDGYRESRRRVLDHIADQRIEGVVFLTGDYHSSWAFEVPPPLGAGDGIEAEDASRAVEFVAPAVSAKPIGQIPAARRIYADVESRLPHLKYVDLDRHGYILLDLTPERVRAHWMYTGESSRRSGDAICGAIQESRRGTNRLQPIDPDAVPG